MKALDAALIALAIGITFTTIFVLSSNYPVGYAAVARPALTHPDAPRSKDFKAIIIHGPSSACSRTRPGSRDVQAHFIIPTLDADGTVRPEPTSRWKEQLLTNHTRNMSVNRKSISIWIDAPSGGPVPVQIEALRDLVARLRAEYGIAQDRVYSHAEVDTVTCGAGKIAANLRACPLASR